MRDPNNFFTAVDCDSSDGSFELLSIEHANALIREALGPKVYSIKVPLRWSVIEHPLDNFQANLFCTKEIGK